LSALASILDLDNDLSDGRGKMLGSLSNMSRNSFNIIDEGPGECYLRPKTGQLKKDAFTGCEVDFIVDGMTLLQAVKTAGLKSMGSIMSSPSTDTAAASVESEGSFVVKVIEPQRNCR
jgi:hypothetical protein